MDKPLLHRNEPRYGYCTPVASKTTYFLFVVLMNSIYQLFYFPYSIEGWEGYSKYVDFNINPHDITVFIGLNESYSTTVLIQKSHFSNRRHLSLCVVDVKKKLDCDIICQHVNGTCQPKTVYSINPL